MLLLSLILFSVISVKPDCVHDDRVISDRDITYLKRRLKTFAKFPILGDEESYLEPQEFNTDTLLNITEIVPKHRYKIEEHYVQTKDGYGLTVHRIPGDGKAVFLMHKVFGSSDEWVLSCENSLAYKLADKGFDVWLGNARGNKYSKSHINLTSDNDEFWDFSFDEIGRYDLPASIDYILETTGQGKLVYVGYSLGSTAGFVLTSELPEYNDKIEVMVSMAPIVMAYEAKSPLMKMMAFHEHSQLALKKALGYQEFSPNTTFLNSVSDVLCQNGELTRYLCTNPMFLLCGFDLNNIDAENLESILKHTPAGGSLKTLEHYTQIVESGIFRPFDYDGSENIELYNSITPTPYKLEDIKVPTVILYSDEDWLSTDSDVSSLKRVLKNDVEFILIENYSHLDFVHAVDVNMKVNDVVLSSIEKYVQ